MPPKASAGVPTMVSVLVSAETMERLMAHQGARAAAQEVVAEIFLPVPETRAEPGDGNQISGDDCQIEGVHERRIVAQSGEQSDAARPVQPPSRESRGISGAPRQG